jgi:pilus assembly protein CpaF
MHKTGLAPKPVLEYLKRIVDLGYTVLVAGSVGAGKTTLVRALTSEIQQTDSILVIEDTPEVRVEHPNVRYVHTREANMSGAGLVNMADCIRASLRMAMDRIILGEIRDPEAAEAFIDVCVTGHPGLSTIHSRNSKDALSRLLTLLSRNQPGVARSAISDQISAAVQVVVFLKYCDKTGERRIAEVREIHPEYGTEHPNQLLFEYHVYDSVPGWKKTAKESYFNANFVDDGGSSPLENVPEFIGL